MKTTPALFTTLIALAGTFAMPAAAHAFHRPATVGLVRVGNWSGTTITVTVSSGERRVLPAWQEAAIPVPYGETIVRATYVQFGVERALDTRKVYVAPRLDARVDLHPTTTARVQVVNRAPFEATVTIGGKHRGTLDPGESRVYATPVAYTDVLLTDGRGQVLTHTRLDARAYLEHRVVAEPPTGDLAVRNPFPFSIEVFGTDGRVRTLEAYAGTVFDDVPVGTFVVNARRAFDDRPIDREVVTVRPGARVEWRIDAPTTGFLFVDSDTGRDAMVYVNGRPVEALEGHEHARIGLPVGTAYVEVRDERGRSLLARAVTIDPFADARLEVTRYDRDDHRDRDDRWEDRGDGRRDDDDRRDHDDRRDRDDREDGQVDADDGYRRR